MASLDLAAIESASSSSGWPEFQLAADAAILTLWFDRSDSLREVSRFYRSALQVITTREFEANIELETNAILAIASRGNLKLMALVVGERHIIAKARYTGSCTSIERRLLERLCPILEGKPIIEASDHSVIDLEINLRDHSLSAPVPGVIMPENTDSMFALPIQLVRDLLRGLSPSNLLYRYRKLPRSPLFASLATPFTRTERGGSCGRRSNLFRGQRIADSRD